MHCRGLPYYVGELLHFDNIVQGAICRPRAGLVTASVTQLSPWHVSYYSHRIPRHTKYGRRKDDHTASWSSNMQIPCLPLGGYRRQCLIWAKVCEAPRHRRGHDSGAHRDSDTGTKTVIVEGCIAAVRRAAACTRALSRSEMSFKQ